MQLTNHTEYALRVLICSALHAEASPDAIVGRAD